MHTDNVLALISESRKLMDYASCMSMATGYKTGKVDLANYSRLLQEAEKEIKGVVGSESNRKDN